MKVLTRLWQMLLKGVQEVQTAGKPLRRRRHAARAAVLRRRPADAGRPDPPDRRGRRRPRRAGPSAPSFTPEGPRCGARGGGAGGSGLCSRRNRSFGRSCSPPQGSPARALASFAEVVALATEKRDLPLKLALERFVRLVAFEDGRLDIALEPGSPQTLANDLGRKLSDWTNRRWMVVVSSEPGAPTLRDQAEARQAEMLSGMRADPLVRAVMERFPGPRSSTCATILPSRR